MDLEPTHPVFNDIIDNNYATGFDEVVRQSLDLSNISAPDMCTALNSVFGENDSRQETPEGNGEGMDSGFRAEKIDIDPFFPPPSPVSPDASLLGLQADPSNYDHIQVNEQERQAGDFSPLSKPKAAISATNDLAIAQDQEETLDNIPGADTEAPSPEANETAVRLALDAPANSTSHSPTLQPELLACPDAPVNLFSQDRQTLDGLATPTANNLGVVSIPQTSATLDPNPLVVGSETPDIEQLLLLLRENPHLPYKKQKLEHNRRFTGTVNKHVAISERTTFAQQNVSLDGKAKLCEGQIEPICSSNPLIFTNPWAQLIDKQPMERIMLDTVQQKRSLVPNGSTIRLNPGVAVHLPSSNDTIKFSTPLTRQPNLLLNDICSNVYRDTNGSTVRVSDPMAMNGGVPNAPFAGPSITPHIMQKQLLDTRASHIEILHPNALENISPKTVRALLRSNGDDIVSKIELYWTHFHDYRTTTDRAGKVLKEKSVRFERRKRMGPEVSAIEKKAIRAQRNRERSQALRRYHKQRMGELEDVNRKLKTYNAVAKSLINCLLEEPQSLELVQEYFSTHECNEELLTFLRS